MVSKIIRADGTTELASIKSVTYHESVNADIDLRPGCVSSAYIEVVCFGTQADAPTVGEALTYYQVVGETETLIGIFYAQPSIPAKNSYSFIAYDAVSKLDTDFSAWLSANQDNFPYTVYQLASQACTIAGVTLGTASWEHSTMSVNAFYADGISCRNILEYAAEIACKFVRCNTSGEIVFDWYKAVNANILDGITFIDGKYYNDSGNLSNSGSTRYEDTFIQVDPRNTYTFEFGSTSSNRFRLHEYTDSQSWIGQIISSPVSNTSITYTPSENARYVRMSYPIACNTISMSLPVSRIYPTTGTFNDEECYAYKQDGLNYENYNTSAVARVGVHPVGEDDVAYYFPTGATGNTLDITNNALLYGAEAADMSAIAQSVYTTMNALGTYRPMRVEMFPNECPFKAGQLVPVTDSQGVSFTTVIMGKTVSDSSVTLESTGREVYGDYAMDTAKQLVQLAADIVRINKLKVDWAEINQIFAEDITVTGQLHSTDYSYTDGNAYANAGIGIDFGTKRMNTPNFGITPDGNLYAKGGQIADFNLAKTITASYYPSVDYIHFYDVSGTASSNYELVAPYNSVLTHEEGTATFTPAFKSVIVSGSSVLLNKFWVQCISGGNEDEERPTPQATIYYYDSNNTVIHTQYWGTLRYYESGSALGNTYILNTQYLNEASYVTLSVDLADGDTCSVYYQYGISSALYTVSSKLGDSDSGMYLGTDGFSAGKKIILTPDGHGAFGDLSTENLYVQNASKMVGNLTMLSPDSTLFLSLGRSDISAGTPPSTNQSVGILGFREKKAKYLGYINGQYYASGKSGLTFVARGFDSSGNQLVEHYLRFLGTSTGTAEVQMSHPAAWLTALGLGAATSVSASSWHSNLATNAGSTRKYGALFQFNWNLKQTGVVARNATIVTFPNITFAWAYGVIIKNNSVIGICHATNNTIITDSAISWTSGTEYVTIILSTFVT